MLGTWNLENIIHRSKSPADQSDKRMASGTGKLFDMHDILGEILARMSCVSGALARMSRVCYEETASVEFKLYYAHKHSS